MEKRKVDDMKEKMKFLGTEYDFEEKHSIAVFLKWQNYSRKKDG